jgi:hypothetical protein
LAKDAKASKAAKKKISQDKTRETAQHQQNEKLKSQISDTGKTISTETTNIHDLDIQIKAASSKLKTNQSEGSPRDPAIIQKKDKSDQLQDTSLGTKINAIAQSEKDLKTKAATSIKNVDTDKAVLLTSKTLLTKANQKKIANNQLKKSQIVQNLKIENTNLSKLQASVIQGQKIQKHTQQSIANHTNTLKNSQIEGVSKIAHDQAKLNMDKGKVLGEKKIIAGI